MDTPVGSIRSVIAPLYLCILFILQVNGFIQVSTNHDYHSNDSKQISTFNVTTSEKTFYDQPNPAKHPTNVAHEKALLRDRIMKFIEENYRSYERPPGHDATLVRVNMGVVSLFSINVQTMDYMMGILLRQEWTDSRLAWGHKPEFLNYNDSLVSPALKKKLWLPDLFFRNGKEGYLHSLTLPNYLLRVTPQGRVLYSQKITMRFSCQMQLQKFPMDNQECFVNIGSYGYTLSELKFVWRDENPVELPSELQISEFEKPKGFRTNDCSDTYSTSTGQYTCLQANFTLNRQLGSYLATTYIPNVLIIAVSWLSFWVNVDSAPARVPLGLLSLLGILTQAVSVSSTLPRVSYIKAIDIWMIFSIIFVIGVLVEYAIALTLLRRRRVDSWQADVKSIVHEELAHWCAVCQQQQLQQLQQAKGFRRDQLEFCEEMEQLLTDQLINTRDYDTVARQSLSSKRTRLPPGLVESEVDNYSRFLFPACYFLYNCIYWVYYLKLDKDRSA